MDAQRALPSGAAALRLRHKERLPELTKLASGHLFGKGKRVAAVEVHVAERERREPLDVLRLDAATAPVGCSRAASR
jgi:hypothetical protein